MISQDKTALMGRSGSWEVTFEYIGYGSEDKYSLSIRILHFIILVYIYENIITILPGFSFSTTEVKNLYGLRWGIKTSFRETP